MRIKTVTSIKTNKELFIRIKNTIELFKIKFIEEIGKRYRESKDNSKTMEEYLHLISNQDVVNPYLTWQSEVYTRATKEESTGGITAAGLCGMVFGTIFLRLGYKERKQE